jgi:hypothetical protein
VNLTLEIKIDNGKFVAQTITMSKFDGELFVPTLNPVKNVGILVLLKRTLIF